MIKDPSELEQLDDKLTVLDEAFERLWAGVRDRARSGGEINFQSAEWREFVMALREMQREVFMFVDARLSYTDLLG